MDGRTELTEVSAFAWCDMAVGVLFGVQLTQARDTTEAKGAAAEIHVGDTLTVLQHTARSVVTHAPAPKTESTGAAPPAASEGRVKTSKLPAGAKEAAKCRSDTGRFCWVLLVGVLINVFIVLYAYLYYAEDFRHSLRVLDGGID